ncbi:MULTISPECIES: Ig-like domain-containing protein [Deinococcus]|uniref:Ig-like domain-containing protein n=1 Tax=Deinococcus rufus TaxID=2136097 RepID=A0ABV7ZBP0_9DEIO|nr:Ig-like domain-containing protein [Deinococcus sp. AB2017081]WQE94029.1 Ig-like domain-containing protein [Deinococcus sp. AB2017081]
MGVSSRTLAQRAAALRDRIALGAVTLTPAVTLSATPDSVTSSGSVVLTAQASNVQAVEFYREDVRVATFTAPPYTYSEPLNATANGIRTYRAVGLSVQATVEASATVTVAIPAVTLRVSTARITQPGTVTLTADVASGVTVASVAFARNGTPLGMDSAAPFTFSESLTYLDNGTRSYTATVTDTAGRSAASASVLVTVAIADTAAPTLSLDVSPDPVTAAGNVTLNAAAADDRGVAKVAFYVDGTLISTDTTAPYSATKAVTAADNGDRTFKAIATDTSGNTSQATRIVPVRIVTPGILYAEPADPWTAYDWNDSVGASSTDAATLVITTALLDQYGRIATDPADGIAKWLLDFRDLPANIRNPRNMTTGKRAIYIKAGNRWVWCVHGQAMGVGGGGTSRGIVGCAGGSKFTFSDFSFHGPHTHMATGQYAGAVRPEGAKHSELRQVNLRRTQGFRAQKAQLGDNNTQGFVMRMAHGWNTNGQIRDTSTNTGWKLGSTVDVDRQVANLWQLASSTVRRYQVEYCISEQEPGDSYIEDTGNSYDVQLYGATDYVRVIWRVEARGAYPMNLGSDYSGGGFIYDGSTCKWLSTEECYALETSNYGFAHAGGGHTRFRDVVAYNRGVAIGGVRPDGTPDTMHYDRDYGSSADTSGRITDGLRGGWGAPTDSDPNRRKDGPDNGTSARGTVFSRIERFNGGVGAIPQSALDGAMAEIQGKRDAAGVVVGRRNPAA